MATRTSRRSASSRARPAKHRPPSRVGTDSTRRARVFAQQNPAAIDAGVFHNDVIAVGHGTALLCHEQAWLSQDAVLAELRACLGAAFQPIVVPAAEVSLDDAVGSYLFNSQLLPRGDGRLDTRRTCGVSRERPRGRLSRRAPCEKRTDRGAPRLRPEAEHEERRRSGVPAARRRIDDGGARGPRRARHPRRRAGGKSSTPGSVRTTATGLHPRTWPTRRSSTNRGVRWTSSPASSGFPPSTPFSSTDLQPPRRNDDSIACATLARAGAAARRLRHRTPPDQSADRAGRREQRIPLRDAPEGQGQGEPGRPRVLRRRHARRRLFVRRPRVPARHRGRRAERQQGPIARRSRRDHRRVGRELHRAGLRPLR